MRCKTAESLTGLVMLYLIIRSSSKYTASLTSSIERYPVENGRRLASQDISRVLATLLTRGRKTGIMREFSFLSFNNVSSICFDCVQSYKDGSTSRHDCGLPTLD